MGHLAKALAGLGGEWWVRRPALPIALLYILGIGLHAGLPHRPTIWLGGFVVALLAAMAAAWVLRRRWPARIFLAVCFILLGTALAQFHDYYYPPQHIGSFATLTPTPVQLEFSIQTPPSIASADAPFRPLGPRQYALAAVRAIQINGQRRPASGAMHLLIDQPHPSLAQGQIVRAIGLLERPLPAMNPGQFDWAARDAQERVLASFTIKKSADLQILSASSTGPCDAIRRIASQALDRGFPERDRLDLATLRVLVLGQSQPELRDVRDEFVRSGTAYQLAVSGMHIAVVGGIVLLLCRLLCCPPRLATLLALGVVLLYGLSVRPAPPVIRAVILCQGFGLSLLLRRGCDKLQWLSLAALAVLLWQPLDLYTAGFQLSFVTVLGMVIFARPMMAFAKGEFEVDYQIAMAYSHPGWFRRAVWWLGRHLRISLGFGLIAWLMSAPLIAYHFDQVNLWSIPAGLAMFPLVAASLLAGLLKIVLTLLAPGWAPAWAALAAAPTKGMLWAVAELAKIPGSYLPAPHLSVGMIFLYYTLICLPLLAPLWPRGRWCLRLSPALACMLALLPLLVGAAPHAGQHDLRMTLLAIGAGQTAVIELPSGGVVLIDDGSSTLTDPVRTCLEPFLRSEGCCRLTGIFLSHPDFDHVSGTVQTVDDLPTACVYISPFFHRQSVGNPHAQYVLDGLAADHCPIRELHRGDNINLDETTQLQVLWPPADHVFKTTNEAGLVLRLACRGRSILFPADIQQLTEGELLQNHWLPACDVLVAPHHGSAETTTGPFIQAVAPQYIVASSDRLLTKKQKDFDVLAAQLGRPLYRTSRCGAITVDISPQGGLRIETFFPSGERLPDAARWKRK